MQKNRQYEDLLDSSSDEEVRAVATEAPAQIPCSIISMPERFRCTEHIFMPIEAQNASILPHIWEFRALFVEEFHVLLIERIVVSGLLIAVSFIVDERKEFVGAPMDFKSCNFHFSFSFLGCSSPMKKNTLLKNIYYICEQYTYSILTSVLYYAKFLL